MLPIMIEQGASAERLQQLGVDTWEIWSCEEIGRAHV